MSEKQKNIGGIWKREGQYGEWLSLSVDKDALLQLIDRFPGQSVMLRAYPNRFKASGDKKPDYQLLPSDPKPAPKRETTEDDIGF